MRATSASDARRTEILTNLLTRSISIESATAQLRDEPWDSAVALVTLSESHAKAELHRFLSDELNARDDEEWANVLESRDDVAFASEHVKQVIFELANPQLEGSLTTGSVQGMLARLS